MAHAKMTAKNAVVEDSSANDYACFFLCVFLLAHVFISANHFDYIYYLFGLICSCACFFLLMCLFCIFPNHVDCVFYL